MSPALMQRLDVEVEPLDSLFGIDASRLPAPADEFRERGAELRLAWAAAGRGGLAAGLINLLRARRRQVSRAWPARAAAVVGAVAGLAGGWWAVEHRHVLPALPAMSRAASKTPPARTMARVFGERRLVAGQGAGRSAGAEGRGEQTRRAAALRGRRQHRLPRRLLLLR